MAGRATKSTYLLTMDTSQSYNTPGQGSDLPAAKMKSRKVPKDVQTYVRLWAVKKNHTPDLLKSIRVEAVTVEQREMLINQAINKLRTLAMAADGMWEIEVVHR